MHYVVRQLQSRLSELGILELLPAHVRNELIEAYRRTSFVMSRKLSTGFDLSLGRELGVDSATKAILKLPIEFKRTRSLTNEASYLGYDEKSAEYDIVRLSRQLTEGFVERGNLLDRFKNIVLRRDASRVKLKLVFVFDELDKIISMTCRASRPEWMMGRRQALLETRLDLSSRFHS